MNIKKNKIFSFLISFVTLISYYMPHSYGSSLNTSSSFKTSTPMSDAFILSIDGGGLRGRISVEILRTLEYFLQQDPFPIHLNEAFDMCGGTSTGGFITLAMNSLNKDGFYHTPDELANIYDVHGAKIFSSSWISKISSGFGAWGPHYDAHILESVAQDIFGQQKMSQTWGRNFVTTVDLNAYDERIICNWDAQKKSEKDYETKNLQTV